MFKGGVCMLKNIRISKKLILTFILVTIISGIAGIVGLNKMIYMNANYSDALRDFGFAQGDIGLFHAEFNDSRTIVRDIIISTDTETMNSYSTKLTQVNDKMDNYFTSMNKEMVSEKELRYYGDIKDNLTKYKNVSDQVVTLAQQNKDTEAQELLTAQGEPLSDKVKISIDSLINEKISAGNQLSTGLESQGNSAKLTILLIVFISFILSLIIALTIARSISKPVRQMADISKRMAAGDLSVQFNVNSKDEIGQLGAAFAESAASIRGYIADITENLGRVEHGDLTVVTTLNYIGDYVDLKNSFQGILASLNDTLGQINQAAEQVLSSSEQVSDGAQALAQGATEQASSVEELSATIMEISDQVKNNAEHATDASSNVNHVSSEIEISNQHMAEMIIAMSKINDSSSLIGKIIKTIEDIAFQTNILALNAAVEAARAGAAGKGFAVVADEVRNLASKSAEAAKNTTSLIEDSIKQVENGTRIADETAKSLLRVVEGAKVVADTVEKISQASNCQSNAIIQVTQGIEQISNVVQTNSATAEESAAASEELSDQARTLKLLVEKFKLRNPTDPNENDQFVKPSPQESEAEEVFSNDKY